MSPFKEKPEPLPKQPNPLHDEKDQLDPPVSQVSEDEGDLKLDPLPVHKKSRRCEWREM